MVLLDLSKYPSQPRETLREVRSELRSRMMARVPLQPLGEFITELDSRWAVGRVEVRGLIHQCIKRCSMSPAETC